MKVSKRFVLGMIAATIGMVNAAAADMHMQPTDMAQQRAMAPAHHQGYGVLKEVDAAAGKVQLAHHEIPSLHWPAMTMWFDWHGTLPNNVKVGDTVRFELAEISRGKWAVTSIEPAK